VRDVLKKDFICFLAIAYGLASPRKVARRILPEIKEKVEFEVRLDSVAKAVERCVNDFKREGKFFQMDLAEVMRLFTELRLKLQSNVGVLGIKVMDRKKFIRVLNSLKPDSLLAVTFGEGHATVVVDESEIEKLVKVMGKQKVVYCLRKHAALSIIMPKRVLEVPGIAALVFSLLATAGLNVVEVLSSCEEGILVMRERDAIKAFSLLKEESERLKHLE